MVLAFGRNVAVGLAGDTGVCWFGSGFGMETRAMLDGVGVAGPAGLDAQLENINAHTIRTKILCVRSCQGKREMLMYSDFTAWLIDPRHFSTSMPYLLANLGFCLPYFCSFKWGKLGGQAESGRFIFKSVLCPLRNYAPDQATMRTSLLLHAFGCTMTFFTAGSRLSINSRA